MNYPIYGNNQSGSKLFFFLFLQCYLRIVFYKPWSESTVALALPYNNKHQLVVIFLVLLASHICRLYAAMLKSLLLQLLTKRDRLGQILLPPSRYIDL